MNISSMLLLLPIHNTLSFLLAATFIEGAVLEISHHHPSAFLFRRPPSLHSESSLSSTATSSSIRGGKLHVGGIRSTDAAHSPRPTGLFLSSGSGFGNKKSQSPSTSSSSSTSPSNNELFELQELRAQLQTILKQNISYQSLSKEKREELTKYVLAVIDKTESPINVSGRDGNTMGIAKFVVGIENKSWRMVFTTNSSDGGDNSASLPAGSTVILRVGEFLGMQGKLDYVLKYGERILGLNELVAKSTCSVDVSDILFCIVLFSSFIFICSTSFFKHSHGCLFCLRTLVRLARSIRAFSPFNTKISKVTSLVCRMYP